MRPRLTSDDDLRWLEERLEAMDGDYRIPPEVLARVRPESLGDVTSGCVHHGRVLALTARLLEPRVTLELGRGVGLGTLMLYAGLRPGNELWSVDREPPGALLSPLVIADPHAHILTGDCLDLELYDGYLPVGIDLLRFDAASEDIPFRTIWDLYRPLCRPGALIILCGLEKRSLASYWRALDAPKARLHVDGSEVDSGWFVHDAHALPEEFDPVAAMEAARAAVSTGRF